MPHSDTIDVFSERCSGKGLCGQVSRDCRMTVHTRCPPLYFSRAPLCMRKISEGYDLFCRFWCSLFWVERHKPNCFQIFLSALFRWLFRLILICCDSLTEAKHILDMLWRSRNLGSFLGTLCNHGFTNCKTISSLCSTL